MQVSNRLNEEQSASLRHPFIAAATAYGFHQAILNLLDNDKLTELIETTQDLTDIEIHQIIAPGTLRVAPEPIPNDDKSWVLELAEAADLRDQCPPFIAADGGTLEADSYLDACLLCAARKRGGQFDTQDILDMRASLVEIEEDLPLTDEQIPLYDASLSALVTRYLQSHSLMGYCAETLDPGWVMSIEQQLKHFLEFGEETPPAHRSKSASSNKKAKKNRYPKGYKKP